MKNEYGRCMHPSQTESKLKAVLSAKHDYWIHEEDVAPGLHWSALFVEDLDFRAMGKGVDSLQSRVGALAEAAEWLTQLDAGKMPGFIAAHQRDIENALPIEDLLPHIANATPPVLDRIKALECAQYWVDGFSLLDDSGLKIPIEYVRMINGPNGRAAGNSLEEAIVHATNEVFERRVHITVLKNRMIVPTIIQETVSHPIIRKQLDFLKRQGIEVTIKDLSLGGVLPCVGAYFKDPSIPREYQFRHSFKAGSSFNGEEALIRVFTEYAQGRRKHEFRPSSPEALSRILEPDFRGLPAQDDACDNFLSSFMFGFVPYRDASFLEQGDLVKFEPAPGYSDCLEDIEHARRICRLLGRNYAVVDSSDPRTGFAVVQVIIPGYSDVLPFHPPSSPGLFNHITPAGVLDMYG